MLLLKVLSVVFPVFCIIGLGYLFAKFRKVSIDAVIDILLYLTIPALVISSLTAKKFDAGELFTVSLGALMVVVGTGLISYAYLRMTKREGLRGFYLPTMFMNSGNMSFPLALLAFGAEGLAVSVLYYIAISLLVYSIGIYIAKGKGGFIEMFKLPLIYAAGIGLFLNFADIRLPLPIHNMVDMLGAATIPIMQVSLGYKLYSTRLSLVGPSIAGALIRIGGGVLVAYIAVTLMGITGLNKQIILLSSAMPSAVINFILSHKYDVDKDVVASIIAASTLLSVVTTPIVLWWIM